MMTATDRRAWLLTEVERRKQVNVLDAAFVDDYVKATGARFQVLPYGANKCPMLSRDLGGMHADGLLTRYTVTLPYDLCGSMGFPKWIWMYEVRQ